MYQAQYSKKRIVEPLSIKRHVSDIFDIDQVRASMWEEHCLECSAPACYRSCEKFVERQDGRCSRFFDGIAVETLDGSPCARVKFREWGTMMSVVYPGYHALNRTPVFLDRVFGSFLCMIANLPVSSSIKWFVIRPLEYIRRQILKHRGKPCDSDAFILHVYSMHPETFQLILDVYRDKVPRYKTSFTIKNGENFHLLTSDQYVRECDIPGSLIKLYPEKNINADVVFLFGDFVKGHLIKEAKPDNFVKCVVWDLDRTVWDGVLTETDDPNSLMLRTNVLKTIEELDRRGILQSIASKNDKAFVYPQLERLGIREYFLYPQISWGPKSEAIRNIAKGLNIGIDSFAFADDSAFERNQVLGELPEVRVYDEQEILNALSTPPFSSPITPEGKKRRQMYIAETKRQEDMNSREGMDISGFIKSCQIVVDMFTPQTEDEIDRCFELLQRTNQLNISGIKYHKNEFLALLRIKNRPSFALKCRDKYGDYGIVGFIQYEITDEELRFREFAVSCRVAGRHVESALFTFIKRNEICKSYRFPVKITPKNHLLRNTVLEAGFQPTSSTDDGIEYSFDGPLNWADDVTIEWSR